MNTSLDHRLRGTEDNFEFPPVGQAMMEKPSFRCQSKQVHSDNNASEVDILGHFGTFRDILGHFGTFWENSEDFMNDEFGTFRLTS